MTTRRPPACESLALPHRYAYARPYVVDWRCPAHTPAAEAGRAETPPGPGWPIHRIPPPDGPPTGPNTHRPPLKR